MTTGFKQPILVCLLLATLAALRPSLGAAQPAADPQLAQAQAHLDAGDGDAALEVLNALTRRGKPSAEALLLRSTALIMTGDTANGFQDLQRALKLDPGLRQGWLNLAGLEIAEGRYDAAYKALAKARDLAPEESDNDLNLGAVMALQGKLDEATEHFDRYLEAQSESAEAFYLVASNYALAGAEAEAVAHLQRAVEIDERIRLRARRDERFLGLEGEAYRKLLTTDVYKVPPDALNAAVAFDQPYQRENPKLVYAVLDALKAQGEAYDPTVEANDTWALIWTRNMRIKLFTQQNGMGVVQLSANAGVYSEDQWSAATESLFRSIYQGLETPSRIR